MNFRNFALGLTASFAIAWVAVVVIPFFKLRNPAPITYKEGIDTLEGIYHPKRAGRVKNGALVYAQNGCYQCHTQVIRPTYAGKDLGRPNWGGLAADEERGDTRRESNVFDYSGEDFAQIGVTRLGPDLSNFGRRVVAAKGGDAEAWILRHLYNPRLDPELKMWSTCPPNPFLFEKRKVYGQHSDDAIDAEAPEGMEILPSGKARALASYLLSLQRDNVVPSTMNYGPAADDSQG